MVNVEKSPEKEGGAAWKPTEEEKTGNMTEDADEPKKLEEKSDNQGQKDGKEIKCKHKRKKEHDKQGKPKTEAKDKAEMTSKERESNLSNRDSLC